MTIKIQKKLALNGQTTKSTNLQEEYQQTGSIILYNYEEQFGSTALTSKEYKLLACSFAFLLANLQVTTNNPLRFYYKANILKKFIIIIIIWETVFIVSWAQWDSFKQYF